LNILIVGSGYMANEHAKCLKSLGVNISGVISSKGSKSVDNFMSSYYIEQKFTNLEELIINKNTWDAAIICCSEEFTFSYVEKLAKTQKPLLVEKPVTSKLEEFENLILYKNIKVGFNRRFYDTISFLKSRLDKERIDLVKVNIPESSISEGTSKNKYLPELVYSNSIHIFDILFYLFGDISWNSYVKSKKENTLRSCSLLGLNKDEINFSLDLPFDYPENFSITIYSNETRYVLKPIEMLKIYEGIDIQEPSDKFPHRIYKPRLQKSIVVESNKKFKTGLFEQDKSFIEFCRSQKYDSRLASVMDARSSLKAISKIDDLIRK
jgi:predicted dehydrogenase